jgi:hypothetical protein
MATVKVEFSDTEEYRLVIDGADDEEFIELGEAAQVEKDGVTYLTLQYDAEIAGPVFRITGTVAEVKGVTYEDVEIEGDAEEAEVEIDEETDEGESEK